MTWARADVELIWKRNGQKVDVSFPINKRGVNTMRIGCANVAVAQSLCDGLATVQPLNGERGEDFVHLVDRLVNAAYTQAERRMRGRRQR